jgi:hypothetical protein
MALPAPDCAVEALQIRSIEIFDLPLAGLGIRHFSAAMVGEHHHHDEPLEVPSGKP